MSKYLVNFTQSGNFNSTTKFLNKVSNSKYIASVLDRYGKKGVAALKDATPKLTGTTADSWDYIADYTDGSCSLTFVNNNIAYPTKVSVAILLQYGHADRSGHFIQGIDYINPALKPIFDDLADQVWKEVVNA